MYCLPYRLPVLKQSTILPNDKIPTEGEVHLWFCVVYCFIYVG